MCRIPVFIEPVPLFTEMRVLCGYRNPNYKLKMAWRHWMVSSMLIETLYSKWFTNYNKLTSCNHFKDIIITHFIVYISHLREPDTADGFIEKKCVGCCTPVTGLLPDTQNCRLCMHRECRERFPRHRGLGIRHASRRASLPWCMPGLLISGFLWRWLRGKGSRHSRRLHNPQFYVSGKRPMEN